MYYIGIDTGVHTGVAVWDNKQQSLLLVDCMTIHKAMELVKRYIEVAAANGTSLCVRVEDARKRDWFGDVSWEKNQHKLQGAGSVKRDAKIWDDFLADLEPNLKYEMVAPKRNATKLNSDQFKAITKWKGRTNEHSRDAGMLVFGF